MLYYDNGTSLVLEFLKRMALFDRRVRGQGKRGTRGNDGNRGKAEHFSIKPSACSAFSLNDLADAQDDVMIRREPTT
jgi:hypothetical protein